MTWLLKVPTSHTCDLPDIIDRDRHNADVEAVAEAERARWDRYGLERQEYEALPAMKRRMVTEPREPSHYNRNEHSCDQHGCREIRDGSVWQCECGFTYELVTGRWVRVSLVQPVVKQAPGRGTPRQGSTTDAAILGFAVGAVLL